MQARFALGLLDVLKHAVEPKHLKVGVQVERTRRSSSITARMPRTSFWPSCQSNPKVNQRYRMRASRYSRYRALDLSRNAESSSSLWHSDLEPASLKRIGSAIVGSGFFWQHAL